MPARDYTVVGPIGDGSFATVYKVRRERSGETLALKRIDISKLEKREIEDALNEVRVLASLRHAHVVSFLEAFVGDDRRGHRGADGGAHHPGAFTGAHREAERRADRGAIGSVSAGTGKSDSDSSSIDTRWLGSKLSRSSRTPNVDRASDKPGGGRVCA